MIIKKSSEVKLGSNLSKKSQLGLFGTIVYNVHMFRLMSYFFVFLDFGLGSAERTFHRIRKKIMDP